MLLAGVLPVPVAIGEVAPGRFWDWRAGPVHMRHAVAPMPDGCELTIELRAPGLVEAAVASTYGIVVAVLVRNLARVAAREDPVWRK